MWSREGGQVMVMVAGLVLVVAAVTGLAIDGTRAFIHRRTLQNAADAAALAGSSEIDRESFYASGGRALELDVAAAQGVVTAYLARRGIRASAAVDASAEGIRVVLRGWVPTSFLALAGIDRIEIGVESRAEPFAGPAP